MKGNTEYSYLRNIHANKRVKIKKQSTHINKWQKMLSFPPYASKSYPMSPFKPSQRLHCTTECRENSCASSINNLHEYFSVTTLWFIRTNYYCFISAFYPKSLGKKSYLGSSLFICYSFVLLSWHSRQKIQMV